MAFCLSINLIHFFIIIFDDGLQEKMAQNKLNSKLPEADELADLSGHVASMRGKNTQGNPFKYVRLVKDKKNFDVPTENISQEDIDRATALLGKDHPAVQKMVIARKGTDKGASPILSEKSYQKAKETGRVVTSKTGMTSGPAVNPMARSVPVNTSISKANRLGITPKFEGKPVEETPATKEDLAKLKPDPAKRNRNTNRGGRAADSSTYRRNTNNRSIPSASNTPEEKK